VVGNLGADAQTAVDLVVTTFRMVAIGAIQDAERGLIDARRSRKPGPMCRVATPNCSLSK
jgi:hypothetical protein